MDPAIVAFWSMVGAVAAASAAIVSAAFAFRTAAHAKRQADAATQNMPPIVTLTADVQREYGTRGAYFYLTVQNDNRYPIEILEYKFIAPKKHLAWTTTRGVDLAQTRQLKPRIVTVQPEQTILPGFSTEQDSKNNASFIVERPDQGLISTGISARAVVKYRVLDAKSKVRHERRRAVFS